MKTVKNRLDLLHLATMKVVAVHSVEVALVGVGEIPVLRHLPIVEAAVAVATQVALVAATNPLKSFNVLYRSWYRTLS